MSRVCPDSSVTSQTIPNITSRSCALLLINGQFQQLILSISAGIIIIQYGEDRGVVEVCINYHTPLAFSLSITVHSKSTRSLVLV